MWVATRPIVLGYAMTEQEALEKLRAGWKLMCKNSKFARQHRHDENIKFSAVYAPGWRYRPFYDTVELQAEDWITKRMKRAPVAE